VKSHKDLEVWQLAVELAVAVYAATKNFPKEEQFGLSLQMRRSAVSIPSNIAEGAARHGKKEFLQFLYVSLGSASELETQLEIAGRVGLGTGSVLKQLDSRSTSVSKMLQGLIRSVRERQTAQSSLTGNR
jgi:four helix bundle protein